MVEMVDGVIRFKNMRNIDKTLYYQCREYIKLCLLVEELQCFKENDEYEYGELIDNNLFKANLLLLEINESLKRIKQGLDNDGND